MNRQTISSLAAVGFIALGFMPGGCVTKPLPVPPDYLKVTTNSCPYQISPLDKAAIILANGYSQTITVSHDGTVPLPSGTQAVIGKSATDFKALLATNYPGSKEIRILEFKDNRISVLGEVFHQLHTELSGGPMRLMDAIAAANGFTALADKKHVRLVRENAGEVEVYEIDFQQLLRGENLRQNILLKPGDVITVPRNFL